VGGVDACGVVVAFVCDVLRGGYAVERGGAWWGGGGVGEGGGGGGCGCGGGCGGCCFFF